MPAPLSDDRRSENFSRMMKRSWLLIALLRAHGYVTLDQLARECDTTTRTIRRDLKTLELAGIPIEQADERGGGWRLLKGAPCACCGARPRETSTERSINARHD
jgi:biotin operon repressor